MGDYQIGDLVIGLYSYLGEIVDIEDNGNWVSVQPIFGNPIRFRIVELRQPSDEQIAQWREYHRLIFCKQCNSTNQSNDATWRWNGTRWEHRCADVDPQAGHWEM